MKCNVGPPRDPFYGDFSNAIIINDRKLLIVRDFHTPKYYIEIHTSNI